MFLSAFFFHCRSFLPWWPLDSLSASITFSGFSFNETRLFCILSLASALSLLSTSVLSPVQTDAALLANNSQHFWMLHVRPFAHPVACCWMLSCCLLFRKVWNRSNFSANNSQHFFCSVIAEASRNNVGSVCTALPTLLGPRTLSTHGLQRLMGCILPTMHFRSQHCWELLHPFAHHCQHVRNNSQHCGRNNARSCCVRLHTALAYKRQTFLLAHRRWGTFREEERLRLSDRNSILMTQNLSRIRSEALNGRRSSFIVLAIVYEWQTKDKRRQRSNINAMNL